MAFRRLLAQATGQVLLFACGVGLLAAVETRLYACAAVLVLLALWIAGATVWSGRRTTPPALRREAPEPATLHAEHRLLASLLDQTPVPLLVLGADGALGAQPRRPHPVSHRRPADLAPRRPARQPAWR